MTSLNREQKREPRKHTGSLFFGSDKSNTDHAITITLVANAGVFVEYNAMGFLVDGVHQDKDHPFSPVSPNDIRLIQQRKGLFKNLDYLLFSHEHPDHFSPQHVLEHTISRPLQGLFLPGKNSGSLHFHLLLGKLQQSSIRYWTLGLEPGEKKQFTLDGGVTVSVIGTRHMGPQYQNVRNDCFLLTMGGKNLLFTGDADYVSDYFENALKNTSLDVVFVNPLFYHNPEGQKIINEIFCPAHVVIYHIPFKEDDSMRLSNMVRRDVQRYCPPKIQTHIFNSKKQFICLP